MALPAPAEQLDRRAESMSRNCVSESAYLCLVLESLISDHGNKQGKRKKVKVREPIMLLWLLEAGALMADAVFRCWTVDPLTAPAMLNCSPCGESGARLRGPSLLNWFGIGNGRTSRRWTLNVTGKPGFRTSRFKLLGNRDRGNPPHFMGVVRSILHDPLSYC